MKLSTQRKLVGRLESVRDALRVVSEKIKGSDIVATQKLKDIWERSAAAISAISQNHGVDTIEITNQVIAMERSSRWLVRRGEGIDESEESLPLPEGATEATVEMVELGEVQKAIIEELRAAQQICLRAYGLAVERNPMSEDVIVFQEIKRMGQNIDELVRNVGKARGL